MDTHELAAKIYNHVKKLRTSGEHWDEWDDKREIDYIAYLIENLHEVSDSGAGFQGESKTDGLSGFRG